jgi:hypothetical protein
MRLPRVQFTMRWMIIAVTLVALAFWLTRLAYLSGRYKQQSYYHAGQEKEIRQRTEAAFVTIQRVAMDPHENPLYQHLKERQGKDSLVDYHASMRVKYEWAALHPWYPLAPDPPPPKP